MPAQTTRSGRKRAIRWPLLGLLLVVALTLAACGGGDDSDSANPIAGLGEGNGTVPEAAQLLPADAPILITINTDLDSDQWQRVSALADRFPASQDVIDEALRDLAGEGLDFETDVRPALGADATIALLEVNGDDPPVAVILKPADPAQLEALIARSQSEDPGSAPVWRVVDDWYVLADDDATIDRVLAGADTASLADDDQFKAAMESLPGESVARLWISPAVTDQIIAEAAADDPAGFEAFQSIAGLGQGTFDGASFAMLAVEEGISVVGVSKTTDAPVPGSGPAEILDLAPADALAYVSLRDLRQSVEQIVDLALAEQPDAEAQLGQAEALLGLTIEEDLLPLFENEHAVYVRTGVPIPEITIVLSPDDPDESADLIKQLVALAEIGGLMVASDTVTVAGEDVLRLGFEGVSVFVASIEGRLVLTTAEAGITDFGGENSLRDDPRFTAVSSAVGLPDETAGFVYVDIERVVELVTVGGLLGAAGAGDIGADELRNLDPLGALLLYGTASADEQRFAGLLTIE